MIFLNTVAALTAAIQTVYTNPVLHADYSDPDVIRVEDDYWMTASSFNCVPGLQILHSKNLVEWEIVNAALPGMYFDEGTGPAHGCGVWAPSIRCHDGVFYIFWGDPDRGIFFVTAEDPCGEWSEPYMVISGKGMIDPCPLWDDDGRVWLVHGWAGSRAGFKSVLSVVELSADCRSAVGEEILVFDGKNNGNPTVEGPKFYKKDGYYYIFAPAGGVKEGWQLVLRSENVTGPYEWRKVMHQGDTGIHGPHQGGWVDDIGGGHWFLHFEDRYAYGRVVHLQPLTWSPDGWCVIGIDSNGDGIGEPVSEYRYPASPDGTVSAYSASLSARNPSGAVGVDALGVSDDFSSSRLSFIWQWHSSPQTGWLFLSPSTNSLRMNCIMHPDGYVNHWDTPNLLLRKIVGTEDAMTVRLRFYPSYEGDCAGIIVMGESYSTIGFRHEGGRTFLERRICLGADTGVQETVTDTADISSSGGPVEMYFRIVVSEGAVCRFSYSADGKRFKTLGEDFHAAAGRWIGAKLGFFATSEIKKNDGGTLDILECR